MDRDPPGSQKLTPLDSIERLSAELEQHYGDGQDRELRVAAKLLLAALDKFRQHGGPNWSALVQEYLSVAQRDPEKFARILSANRGKPGSDS